MLVDKIRFHHNIDIKQLSGSLDYWQSYKNLASPYSRYNELLVVIQNPSIQDREELVELQLPYYNYTVHQIVNGAKVQILNYEKFLPRTWFNSNRTIVKSYCRFPVNFDAKELSKVFLIENKGVLRQSNAPPAKYHGKPDRIWNLNLPIFLQKEGWEIDVFQSNYKRGIKKGSKVTAG